MGSSSGDVVTAKAVAICVLFVSSGALGAIPIKLSKWFNWKSGTKNNVYIQMLLCFGGGVLLCTTFLHLLPEVIENVEGTESLEKLHIPLGQLLMCVGFFTMYLVEECVHVYLHRNAKHGDFKSARSSISVSRGHMASSDDELVGSNYHHHIDHSHVDHSHLVIENSTIITLRGFLIILALSIHEIFEGLAIGLEGSAASVWYMFGAVSAHKLVIAFCIGIELVTSGIRTVLILIYVFVFAIASPLGIGIGIAVTAEDESSTNVVSVIMQGLAAGTLLYVVFFEILRDERKSGIRQYISVIIGFLVMFGITFIED